MTPEVDYILGTEETEIARLQAQHAAWAEAARALWRRAGLGWGAAVLDVGCGPGFTTLDLARLVGEKGHVIGRDQSARFLGHLRRERDRLGAAHVSVSLGPVEDLELDQAVDAAYSRWVLSWVVNPGRALGRIAAAVRPGGAVLLQEYLDWGAMTLLPRDPLFDRVVAACMASFAAGGSTIDVGARVVEHAAAAGLRIDSLRPVARSGAAGSPLWSWLSGFFHAYLPKLVGQGALSADELAGFEREWSRRERLGEGYCYGPTVLDALLRKA